MFGTAGPPHDWYNWAPECLVQLCPRMSGTTGPPNGFEKNPKGFERVYEGLDGLGRFRRVWEVWEGFGRFGRVWDGVEGLGWFGRVWAGLGKFREV